MGIIDKMLDNASENVHPKKAKFLHPPRMNQLDIGHLVRLENGQIWPNRRTARTVRIRREIQWIGSKFIAMKSIAVAFLGAIFQQRLYTP